MPSDLVPFQAALNVDAIDHWADPIFQSTYHESGIIVVDEEGTQGSDSVKARHGIVSAAFLQCYSARRSMFESIYTN